MIRYLCYVPCLEKNLLSISSIIKHSPHLHISFSNNRCLLLKAKQKYGFYGCGRTRLISVDRK
jgi:hypothetical protein